MATVTIILRKDKINKKGEAPIHFLIIKNRKPSYISTGLMIPTDKLDEKNKKIKPGVKNSARLNSYLANKFTQIQDGVFEHETISRTLTSRNLKDKVFGKQPADFLAFADNVVEQYKKEGKIGSYQKSLSIISKLREFVPNGILTFHDITLGFLSTYENYYRTKHKNKTNTIHKDMKFFRKIFNDAIRQDIIEYEFTPFRKYQMKTEKTQRFYLTEEELDWIGHYPATPKSKIELHRIM